MPCCPKLKKLVFHQQSGMCDDGAKLDAPIFDMIARCCPLLEELHVPRYCRVKEFNAKALLIDQLNQNKPKLNRSALASNQANQTHQIEDKLRAIFSKGVVVIT